ncbi:hypothetical protein [Atopomonas hussainii]|uniref:hypothetical protein n=1 Tax=Atopomonas hussainii TaxID=1429083 RepID=UPI0011135DD1|nr:hypothetical protein [Atopomonas hussainii]
MMNKLTSVVAFSALFAASSVMAADVNVTIANGYAAVGTTTGINNARSVAFTALANRAGFVKNNFDATLSANVIAGVNDDAANSRFGVVAASNKGYTVFTGSSVGGSIAQCGDIVPKTTTNLASSFVVTASLNLANANGCGRSSAAATP